MPRLAPPLEERRLRRGIRSSLLAWSEFALRPMGQVPAAHHLALIDALERLDRGETRRLLVLLPPGSAKSTYASRLFPAWWMARHPASAVLAASHTASLASEFGRGVRDLMEAHAARLDVRVRADVRSSGRFMTDKGGDYFAVGVHGAVTGRRADLAVIDDPVSGFADAESRRSREHLWNWFRTDFITRMKPRGRIVVAMTRWHVDDLAGRLLEQGGWTSLRLPALAEAGDPMGRAAGEALWPDWEDREALLEKQRVMGSAHFSALFQQTPLRHEGAVFDPRDFRAVDIVPGGSAVRAWDLAATSAGSGNPDWTVGMKVIRSNSGMFFIDDVVRFRGGPAEVVDGILATAARDGQTVAIGLPRDPGQAGHAQVLFLTQSLAGFRVEASPETGSKATRATAVVSQAANGNIAIRRAGWNTAFLDEVGCFPVGDKDDQVDAMSRAFMMLAGQAPPARYANLPFFGR